MTRTLFLNPNSNAGVTELMRRLIAQRIAAQARYEVKCLEGAPDIIDSPEDNERAGALIRARIGELCAGFDRVVLMSSLDTGFEAASAAQTRAEVRGFTRCVLARHGQLGHQLRAITFDARVAPLYDELFETDGNQGVVLDNTVIPMQAADVSRRADEALAALRPVCWRLARQSTAHVFIVGAVGLVLAQTLREEGHSRIIDPIADMVACLGT